MRLLNGMKMFGHALEIKAFERTNQLIKEFYEYKKHEIMKAHTENGGTLILFFWGYFFQVSFILVIKFFS